MININNINITIDGKKIIFKFDKTNNTDENSISNNNQLFFKKEYFLGNKKIISNIINGIVLDKDINNVTVVDYELVPDVIDVVNNVKKITTLTISEDKEISNKICEKLLKAKYIKNVNCYNASIYILDNLDKKNIKVNFRVEYFSLNKFIVDNKLNSYSKMYYKETINFDELLSNDDIKEFKLFLEINNHLKRINIYNFSFELVKQIIKILGETAKGDIQILLRANSDNASVIQEAIPHFRTLDKIYRKKMNFKFKIIYSFEYKKKNTLKQVSNNVLLVSCIILSFAAIFSIAIIEYNNYILAKHEKELQNITKVEVENYETNDPELDNDSNTNETVPEEEVENTDNNTSNNTNSSGENYTPAPSLSENYQNLLSINNETVGWLKVNNTRIDYPVVKASNNDYYLNHNFYKQSNFNGWIYMDYRNNPDNLDQNTIIYGHNLKNGSMFGSLNNVKNGSWYNNPDNLVITFNTITKQMKWQIFSIYVVNVTNDYLYANFDYDSQFKEFVDKLKGRSIKDFGVEISKYDKILTLTTCQNNSKQRLVVHAKLIN